jgi:hypothetical protein
MYTLYTIQYCCTISVQIEIKEVTRCTNINHQWSVDSIVGLKQTCVWMLQKNFFINHNYQHEFDNYKTRNVKGQQWIILIIHSQYRGMFKVVPVLAWVQSCNAPGPQALRWFFVLSLVLLFFIYLYYFI